MTTSNLLTITGLLLGVFGLIASSIGGLLAYFTFIDPRKRLSSYLDKVDVWETISTSIGGHDAIWRYINHPEFVIEIKDDSKDWDSGVKEPWMNMPLQDPHKTMYMVHITVSGTVLYAEKFIALDGWRYFVPIPRIEPSKQSKVDVNYDPDNYVDDRKFYYDEVQIKLSRIIGKLHGEKSIEEFSNKSNISISQEKK